ncbi:uncharacterized protein B0I36DRAFT_109807 [Microdochium trichocladiopsis]|uniref:Fucose-specific lectin n=1 Tax=Microdochium trichocladiopsis TaxID=1682393 RepID=A0A9P9BS86_9PEZI|nr:uncharacterized protein B0I36DRAFT_109807 [Microdochium trichocladiopsis]KAH7033493.1 hypothetical protein B0I36DRAFT_109807 [Microdochium trichocladiopsis]
MACRLVRATVIFAASWTLLVGLAQAGAIAVWNPDVYAPQVIMQDDASGIIFSSRCNSNGSTIFPNDVSSALDIDKRLLPRRKSRLAAVGWWSEDGDQWAAIQHQTKDNAIVHSLWMCNADGQFDSMGQWIISYITPGVRPNTGLASVILSRNAGFRVYYQDNNNSTCALSYSAIQGVWKYDGVVSHDGAQGSAISAAWTTPEDIHIARPRGEHEIEVARLHNNVTWELSTFPTPLENVTTLSNSSTLVKSLPSDSTNSTEFALNTTVDASWTLEAWDGNTTSIWYTIDSANKSSIFYIGTDALVHQVEQVGESWRMAPAQNASVWPPADSRNSELGATYSILTGEAWLYYMSGGHMVAAYRSSNSQWEDARVLGKSNVTTAELQSQGGLTLQAKIGVGVGIGLGVSAIAGFLLFVVLLRRRQARVDEEKWQASSAKGSSEDGSAESPSSAWGSNWPRSSDGSQSPVSVWIPEAHSRPVHELEEQVRTHELADQERISVAIPEKAAQH